MTIEERADAYIGHPFETDESVPITMARSAYRTGAKEQKSIDDEKYKRLRELAYNMYNHAMYLTDDAQPLRKSMGEFHHYICFEEEKFEGKEN